MYCSWCLTHWFQFQCSRTPAKKRTWETFERKVYCAIPVRKWGGRGLQGWSWRRIGLSRTHFSLNSFQMWTILQNQSAIVFLLPPTPSVSFLVSFTAQKVLCLFTFEGLFFLTIDPQPSASINPASSVCSVRQTTPPPSPEFTLGLHFITDAEDNQYELGGWCQVKKHNLPEHTVLFVSTKDCWSCIYP